MSYVATPEEVEFFKTRSSAPEFSQEGFEFTFTTTTEFIASVLPPGFEPASKPTGKFLVVTMESSYVGEFDCGLVSLDCIYNGMPGIYCLEMIISGDSPVTWGREVWGETKKEGTVKLYRSGDYRYAYVERNGVRLIEVEGVFGNDEPAVRGQGHQFEIKAYPNALGTGLEFEPIVNTLKVVENHTRRASGKGRVTIRGTHANPLHSIPIQSLGRLHYVSGLAQYTVESSTELGCGEAYFPYLIGRHYDDLRQFRVGAAWTDLQNEETDPEVLPVRRFTTG